MVDLSDGPLTAISLVLAQDSADVISVEVWLLFALFYITLSSQLPSPLSYILLSLIIFFCLLSTLILSSLIPSYIILSLLSSLAYHLLSRTLVLLLSSLCGECLSFYYCANASLHVVLFYLLQRSEMALNVARRFKNDNLDGDARGRMIIVHEDDFVSSFGVVQTHAM